jgi:hypothetical protein
MLPFFLNLLLLLPTLIVAITGGAHMNCNGNGCRFGVGMGGGASPVDRMEEVNRQNAIYRRDAFNQRKKDNPHACDYDEGYNRANDCARHNEGDCLAAGCCWQPNRYNWCVIPRS